MHLALAIALYSYAMWFGMAAFGRRQWDDHANGFSAYFGLLARIAPFGEHDGRLVLRLPFTGLAGRDTTPGLLALIAVMLGSVGFDGPSRSLFWIDLRAELEESYISTRPGPPSCSRPPSASPASSAACCSSRPPTAPPSGARTSSSGTSPLENEFLLSLVPIALVYAVAHYFTYLVIQGQYAITLASDPFGRGWDLFGTVDYAPNIAPFSPNTVCTSSSGRSSPATSPASRSRTTGPSRSSPSVTRSAPSTPCWR